MSDRTRLSAALLLSMLLHLLVLAAFNLGSWVDLGAAPPPFIDIDLYEPEAQPLAPPPAPVDPDVADDIPVPAPPAVPESRIVPMPDAGTELPSDDARFLSDRDNVVAEESVRRGDSLESSVADVNVESDDLPTPFDPLDVEPESPVEALPDVERAPLREAAPPAAAASAETAAPERQQLALSDLLPQAGDIVRSRRPSAQVAAPQPAQPTKRDLMPSRRVRFSTGTGVSTLLPSVRDGDVTLLNTKAHQFAPFVRRVAGRVFQHLQIALINQARGVASGAGREFAFVRASMTPQGVYVGAELLDGDSATKLAVPRVLMGVLGDRTFFDENPPPAAVAEDGRIHFRLRVELRVWSAGGGGAPDHRRLSRTFFEGFLGVGLE